MPDTDKGESMEEKLNSYLEFQKQIDDVFGKGTIVVNDKNFGNNVVGTWKYVDDFQTFRANFVERLVKLRDTLKLESNIRVFHNLISNLGSSNNWEGTYAEIVAYNILKNDYNVEYELDVTRKASFALASKMGMNNINYDVLLPDYGVYMDVKAFTDTVGDILYHGIIKKVLQQNEFKSQQLNILPQHPLDENDEMYKSNIQSLQTELAEQLRKMIKKGGKHHSFTSAIVPSLGYHILQGAGVNSSESSYSPYRHAEAMKDFIIKRYCNKFTLRRPFFLVLVNFPWYNQITRNSFGYNKLFYRSIARRTFIQYEKSTILANSINSQYRGKGLAKYVARKLTGLIFIDDNSINGNGYDAYIYTNPNATHKYPRLSTYLEEILRHAHEGDYEDFIYDNY